MRAIVKQGNTLQLRHIPVPEVGPFDVRVQVKAAALCRTDLYVAQGRIETSAAEPLVLGHEFSGVVEAVGRSVTSFTPGDRVTAHPAVACGACPLCVRSAYEQCLHTTFLGVGRNGAFADFVVVPEHAVYPLPHNVTFVSGAFAEPIAASLAPLKAGIHPEQRGAIFGDNRIAELTRRILVASGLPNVAVVHSTQLETANNTLDFIIETLATTETLEMMLQALKPGGTLILKSRQIVPIALNLAAILPKEPTLKVVNYGSMAHGLKMLADGHLCVDDLCGTTSPLEAFETVFAEPGEHLKPFFSFGGA